MRRQAFIARQSELPTITMLFAAVHESALAHFGHGAMSDLSPLCAPERTFTNASRLDSRLTNPHCPHCGCSAQGRPVAPWLRQNNPSGKFSLSPSGKSLLGLTPSCPRGRGVGHRHERWDGMRWTRRCRARDGIAGRASARERSQGVPTSDAEAYGEVVWS
jgi:hypothetical protein